VWDDRDIVSWATAGGRCLTPAQAAAVLAEDPEVEEVAVAASSDGNVTGERMLVGGPGMLYLIQGMGLGHVHGTADACKSQRCAGCSACWPFPSPVCPSSHRPLACRPAPACSV
jgi:hypothetical protein